MYIKHACVMPLVQAESTGSSVDPERKVEHMEVQQSGSEQDSNAAQTSDADKGGKDDREDNTESSTTSVPPPKR